MDQIYTVKIGNMELRVCSSESQEYTNEIAEQVNKKIQEMTGENVSVSVTTAALLTAMDFCDELMKYKANTDNMRVQLKSYMDEASKATAERDEARRLAEKYKNDILALKIELSNQKKDS